MSEFYVDWAKSEILRLYSIVHVAMETTKTSNFTCQTKSFTKIFFTWQVSACALQPFSCHDFANDIHSQTAKVCSATLNPDFLNHKGKPNDQNIMFCLTKKARLFIMITRKLLRIIRRFEKSWITKIQFHYNCIAITNTDWQSRKKLKECLDNWQFNFFVRSWAGDAYTSQRLKDI